MVVAALLAAGVIGACSSSSGTRQVLVDYNNPDFAAVFVAYFPTSVTVHPGMTVHFKQAWNGEPHTVTMGTSVDKALAILNPLLPQLNGNGPVPPDVQAKAQGAFSTLPPLINHNNQVIQQAAQPCYLDTGTPRRGSPDITCPKRAQPGFNGRQTYYSSGFISYAGNNGNSFDVKLANDIKPGTYHWYCSYHGPQMQGTVVVKPKSAPIPSQDSVDKKALAEATAIAAPVDKVIKQASTGPWNIIRAAQIAGFPPPTPDQAQLLKGGFFAGYSSQTANVIANEFLPKTIHAKVGQKLTWVLIGNHTISFNVPSYFPILATAANGKVRIDSRAQKPVGGVGFPLNEPDNPPDLYVIDGGHWDGSGFRSSGLTPNNSPNNQILGFSLTITKAGTYQYACLIHPRMVGTVVVSS
jgi:plastocyanin